MKKSKYTIRFNKLFGDKLKDRKKSTLAKFFKIEKKYLDEVFDRGLAAARNTGMRPGVTSPTQWASARLYKYLLNVYDYRRGKKLNRGPGQDSDLVLKALNKKI